MEYLYAQKTIILFIVLVSIYFVLRFIMKCFDNFKRVRVLEFERDYPNGQFVYVASQVYYKFSFGNDVRMVKISDYSMPTYYDILNDCDEYMLLSLEYQPSKLRSPYEIVLLINKHRCFATEITDIIDLNQFKRNKKVVDISE